MKYLTFCAGLVIGLAFLAVGELIDEIKSFDHRMFNE